MFAAVPGAIRAALLEQQFAAARRGWTVRFAHALQQIIVCDGVDVGSLVTAREPGVLHLVDIALAPAAQRKGIGTLALTHLLALADAEQLTVTAQVSRSNPRAHALYRRLAFVDVANDDVTVRIERSPAAPGTS